MLATLPPIERDALRTENARLTLLPWALELPQDCTAAQAQALLDAFPPPLPAGPQCPECKAWYDDHGSRWPHAPGCSELTRYDRHDAAVWELRDAAYGLARGLIRTEAERDALKAAAVAVLEAWKVTEAQCEDGLCANCDEGIGRGHHDECDAALDAESEARARLRTLVEVPDA